MEYKVYEDKIVLINEAQQVLAEVDFPAIASGKVDVNHTFVDDSLRGQGIAGKLMEQLVAQLRKEHLKAVATCSYAKGWFEKHPEATDVVCE